jgi:uncharacterized protein (DUF169 family)
MDLDLKQRFLERWEAHFPGAELPIVFYYSNEVERAAAAEPKGRSCLICELASVRQGTSLQFDVETVACGGGKRYLGFVPELRPGFEYFLSCGIPGEMEGERYKKSPELVKAVMERMPSFEAPGQAIVFKRWDRMVEGDEPAVVVFFAPPDVLSGLFTLAGYDEVNLEAVTAPFSSGCGSIVYHPYKELQSDRPRCVLGMFDVSARPCVPANVLTFAVPWPKLERMVVDMDESFLITASWRRVQARIGTGSWSLREKQGAKS